MDNGLNSCYSIKGDALLLSDKALIDTTYKKEYGWYW